jgi:hypothetical protein
MERNLYRMFFGLNDSGRMGPTNEKSISFLIQTPDPYVGTEIQVKILRRHAFKLLQSRRQCDYEYQVKYTGHETIPNVPETKNMKADIEIEGANWIQN